MCMNNALYLIMGFLGLISATLLTGAILGFRKSARLKKQVADAKAEQEKADGYSQI